MNVESWWTSASNVFLISPKFITPDCLIMDASRPTKRACGGDQQPRNALLMHARGWQEHSDEDRWELPGSTHHSQPFSCLPRRVSRRLNAYGDYIFVKHHARSMIIFLLAHGLGCTAQRRSVSNFTQMETGIFDLVDTNIDLLIIVLREVYTLIGGLFAQMLRWRPMNRLGAVFTRGMQCIYEWVRNGKKAFSIIVEKGPGKE